MNSQQTAMRGAACDGWIRLEAVRLTRLVIGVCVLVLCYTAAFAQVTFPQTPDVVSGVYDGSNQKTFTLSTPTVGDYTFIAVENENERTFSSVQQGGVDMDACPNTPLNVAFGDGGIWYHRWTGGESDANVVVTISGSDGNSSPMGALVVRGLSSSQSAPQGATESEGSAQSHDVGPITPNAANSVVVAYAVRGNRTWTNGGTGTWTDNGTVTGNLFSWVRQTFSSAQAVTYAFSTTDSAAAAQVLAICALDADASGPPPGPPPGSLLLLGVGR